MSALAPGSGPPGPFWMDWDLDPAIATPLVLAASMYAAGVVRLWWRAGRGHGVNGGQLTLFSAGWLILAAALVSPLHALAERLFAAHMVEHELLMAVAPPLLVLAAPFPAYLWSLPRLIRQQFAVLGRLVSPAWRMLTVPIVATVIHGVAIWVWHIPLFFAAALASEWVHWLQHASFLLTGVVFWSAMFGQRESGYGRAVGHLFATSMHTGLLGALLVLAPRPWFPAAGGFGLSPLEDQQLGGLIMWVPGCMIYAGAALVLVGKWIIASGDRQPLIRA